MPLCVCFPYSDLSISECVGDMVAYSKLNDGVIHAIKFSPDQHLKDAQDLIARLEQRKLYTYIGQTVPIEKRKDSKKPLPKKVRLTAALYMYV